jgi:hypothetical protein
MDAAKLQSAQNAPMDILLLILYKIHLLEQNINIIEEQTKTLWIK